LDFLGQSSESSLSSELLSSLDELSESDSLEPDDESALFLRAVFFMAGGAEWTAGRLLNEEKG
jgi:hypothetical protein